MKVITVESPQGHYEVPLGTRILFDGATAPTNWIFDTTLDGYFVMGADEPDLTARGAANHTHTTPDLASSGAHNDHPVIVSGSSTKGNDTNVAGGGSMNSVGSHSHSGTGTCGSAGAHTHPVGDTGTASNYPKYKTLKWIYSNTSTVVPIGAIVMHNASQTILGTGWQVCDGTGGTPDLRDYFILGGTPGSSGGSNQHTHTMPISGSASATHQHSISIGSSTAGGNNNTIYEGAFGTISAQSHSHSGSATSPSAGAHTHSINNVASATSLPNYINLYFIKRIA